MQTIEENLWEHFLPRTPTRMSIIEMVIMMPETKNPSCMVCSLLPPEKIPACPWVFQVISWRMQ